MKNLPILFTIVLLLVASGCDTGDKTPDHKGKTPAENPKKMQTAIPPVTVTKARKGDMPVYLTAIATVTPLNTVTVRSRVDGELKAVHFVEGSDVKKGDLLAEIDSRPFEIQLKQARAQLAKDTEQLRNARTVLERYRVADQQNAISKQQLDTQEALVKELEAAIEMDKAQIEAAKLQITYSRITAPISGRIGLRLVDPGNMVRSADSSGLFNIVQTRPISVVFAIPQDHLPQLLERMKGARPTVEAFDREMKQKIAVGELTTIDNQIDPSTGTIKLKAIFKNENNELFPNQFVNVRLVMDIKRDALIVPSAAVQRTQQSAFVFVLNPRDSTVVMRQVRVDATYGGETVIVDGLKPEELVVVDGAERLKDGAKVQVLTSSNFSNNTPRYL